MLSESDLKKTFISFLEADTRAKNCLFAQMIPTFNYLSLFIFNQMGIKDRDLRKDIMQDVFIKLIKVISIEKVQNSTNLSGYIRVIIKNKIRDYYRVNGVYERYKTNFEKHHCWANGQ